ncbi:MAG: NUDIX hydrolase [Paracoccus sp. (in: a-proteobacteria)]|nr:NUDIX hydrolase [Paracoccus sp. (in: a-proteobacteria)]
MNDMMRNTLGKLLGRRPPALQVGALCLDPPSGRVLLITSRGTGRWIIPKGWPMSGLSAAGAALREAWEEAGVEGKADETPLGHYHYDKQEGGGLNIPINVQVHLVRVSALADDFPEARDRKRAWFTPAEAAPLVAEPELQDLLRGFAP